MAKIKNVILSNSSQRTTITRSSKGEKLPINAACIKNDVFISNLITRYLWKSFNDRWSASDNLAQSPDEQLIARKIENLRNVMVNPDDAILADLVSGGLVYVHSDVTVR